MTAFDRILSALDAHGSRVTGSGRQRMAQCPVPSHDDHNPSLSVTGIEGQALIYCHSPTRCSATDVTAALGLSTRDLFDDADGVRYAYTDANGKPTRYVHRTPGKAFRQSGDTRGQPQLYRLPAVVDAVKNGVTVYLVEGEKDCAALEILGAVATTSPMGAKNFHKVDASPLEGAHVVIVPDQDDGGARYLRDALTVLEGFAASVKVARPKVGKDAADHVAAGYGLDALEHEETPPTVGHRTITLTAASTITVRPVKWLWDKRVALGTLALLGGREGIGKSMIAYSHVADITRGRLPGEHEGQPRAVIVAATEDSWEHTIVPRLMAHGADLSLVYRVDVTTAEGVDTGLSLPRDLVALEQAVNSVRAVLILLDPLMSRLDAQLDTHKDAEVRIALEPLVAIAARTRAAIIGLIHVNKSASTDALTTLMGSRAFTAVARAVLFVMTDPEDQTTRLLGQPKNNLGTLDLATFAFTIASQHVADTDEGPVWTGKVVWQGESALSIREALEASGKSSDDRTATSEAAAWLEDHLASQGGADDSANIKSEGAKADHSISALRRARRLIGATFESQGFPRRTQWVLPSTYRRRGQRSESIPGESHLTELNELTRQNGQGGLSSRAVGSVGQDYARGEPTGNHADLPWTPAAEGARAPTCCLDCGWMTNTAQHVERCFGDPPQLVDQLGAASTEA